MSFANKSLQKTLLLLLAITLAIFPVLPNIAQAEPTGSIDLFFSEYVEGSSNNKAIEIYNGTGNTVDLSNYSIELYSNGSTDTTATHQLNGTLANKAVYVLVHPSANATLQEKAHENSTVTNFNGNDALVLKKGNQIIDTFYTVGQSETIAKDVTLTRKSHVTTGSNSFTLDEWQTHSIDTFNFLGTHSTSETQQQVEAVQSSPQQGMISKDTNVSLSTPTEQATIYFTTDGSDPTTSSTPYTTAIQITQDTTIKAIAVKDGMEASTIQTFTYLIEKDLDIHDIQGTSHSSPYVGQTVTQIDGIVTHIDGDNIYMQEKNPDDDLKTSEGLLVYKRDHSVKIGDHISVDGQVKEYVLDGYSDKLETDLSFTEIAATNIEVLSSGNVLPEPVILGKNGRVIPDKIIDNDRFTAFDPEEDAIDFYESLEGMRVQLNNAVVVGPQKYGDLSVVVDNGTSQVRTNAGGYKLTKEDPNPEILYVEVGNNFVAKVGDSFNGAITGVLSYDYGTFKVYRNTNEALPSLQDGGLQPETTTIEANSEHLTVATYNLENFSAQSDEQKVTRIATSIVNQLKSPDIIALVEVQDNDGSANSGNTSADASYTRLINKIRDMGGPSYHFTDIAPENNQDGGQPGGNIRVGYIYNPDHVQLTAGQKGTATEAVTYQNGKLSKNPGRIAPDKFQDTRKPLAAQFEFNGEEVVVIAAHLNSKRGDYPLFGKIQPPTIGSEAERIELATEINQFVKAIESDNQEANVIVLGDLNDFEFSKPLDVLKGSELTNLVDQLPESERWTYNYRGNSQALDHILVSNHLAKDAEIDIVHINSPFMEAHGRASDHDPVLAQIDLTPNKVINILHTNDSHARVFEGKYDGMGFAKLSTLIKQFEQENEHTLLLDAGDTFHGTTFATLEEGSSIVKIMNEIGYDSMAAGNHDSNYGFKRLLELEEMADFPVLSANVFYEETGELVLDPYTIREVNGVAFGIFGLSTPETHYKTHPKNVEGLKFTDPVEAAKKMVAELQGKNVDVIVALTHLGTDASSTDTSLKVAQGAPGIDLIVDGHSHTIDDIENSGTLIVSAGEYLKNLGVVEIVFNEKNEIVSREASLITKEDAANIEPDPAVQAVIDTIQLAQEEILAEEIGTTLVKLDGEREQVRAGETNLGNLITDAMLEETGADIALTNGGGIRASIDKGVITIGDVITVLPFGNYIQTLEVPGSIIKEALENGVSDFPEVKGAFPHVAGMTFAIDINKPKGERVHSIKIHGKPIDLNKMYTLATNDFLAAGGDEYTMFANFDVTGDYAALDEAVIQYIKKRGTIEPKVENRIVSATTPSESHRDDNTENIITPKINNGKASISKKDFEAFDPSKDIKVELGNAQSVVLELTEEQVKALKENKQSLRITNNQVELQIPSQILPDGKVSIQLKRLEDVKEAVSATYDFTIIDQNGNAIHQFDTPVILTFTVDLDNIQNTDQLNVYYYNEQRKVWEQLLGSVYKAGKVTASTDHFSIFAVFERTEASYPAVESTSDSLTNSNGSTNGNTLSAPTNKEYSLPNTATSTYNLMAWGFITLALGGVLILIQKRKEKHSS